MSKAIILAVCVAAFAGCSWQESVPVDTQADRIVSTSDNRRPVTPAQPERHVAPRSERLPARVSDAGVIAATAAQQQIGVAYRYGGSDTSGFDCSGLVQYAYGQAGIKVPRTTGQQWSAASVVGEEGIRPGDVLFFNISGKPSHVGIYVGDGFFVHAPSTGKRVSTERLNDRYYRTRLLKIGRFSP